MDQSGEVGKKTESAFRKAELRNFSQSRPTLPLYCLVGR